MQFVVDFKDYYFTNYGKKKKGEEMNVWLRRLVLDCLMGTYGSKYVAIE